MSKTPRSSTGLRQFLDVEQQRNWTEGKTNLPDADERSESVELRFKYVPRFHKLAARPQAQDVLKILGLYGQSCIPMPRRTERQYWSVSCLPSTPDKPLVRVNASWMELFTIYADGEGIRARFILHLPDFTTDHSPTQDQADEVLLERCVTTPEDVSYFFPRGEDIFGINVRGSASIHKFLATPHVLRAIRRFNLTHMNEPLLRRRGLHAGRLSGWDARRRGSACVHPALACR
ncbi:hypothetical protein [Devosia sp. LC5]|uniref:hypothetical protein n=1 Tax=Devosia sp. LC5 TaxID=1502724 RepID=UPI001FCC32A1|nr:hypothetical protein [Devosia sp. LC5]